MGGRLLLTNCVLSLLVAGHSSIAQAHPLCIATTCCSPHGATHEGTSCLFQDCHFDFSGADYIHGTYHRVSVCAPGLGVFGLDVGICKVQHGNVDVRFGPAPGYQHLLSFSDWVADDLVAPLPDTLWPPNHKLVTVDLAIAANPPWPTTIQIVSVRQDESLDAKGDGSFVPDAVVVDEHTVSLRAERAGSGDGRVYHIAYQGVDTQNNQCAGEVTVCVPHSKGTTCVDGGGLFDSTAKAE